MPSSPMFLASLDARMALEKAQDKLRNVRRRELTKTERYGIDLILDAAYDLEEMYDRKTGRERTVVEL